ncbi:hypothetical protein [Jannaschia sp. R86511]|uniref:hypothetical protein n=1 Tax=Jannaschia sp. R86511 TaxID=3093853 RepID=UPI0036D35002
MGNLASSGVYANAAREPVPPAPPLAPSPRGLVAWGTSAVVMGVFLCVGGPWVALALLPELSYYLPSVGGWVAGLLTTVAVVLSIVAGVAMITLGRGVRALAWLAHRALEQDASKPVSNPSAFEGRARRS